MKNQLEDFVRQNRGEFDDREASPRVWKGIESALGLRKQSWKQPLLWWRAAAIFFMALSAYLMIPKEKTELKDVQAMKEFSDVEAFYVQQISNKVELIDEFSENEGLNDFTQDFQQLEAMYLVLKEEMKASPSEKVKDALVLNLLVRIDLLNQQLQRLEDEKLEENEAGEESENKSA